MANNFNKVKDSGEVRDFGTGAVRDIAAGKGRFDLLPMLALFRLAKHFENGSNRYRPRNWEAGIPLSNYWSSAFRHMLKMMLGMEEEDHSSAAGWNLMCFIETKMRIELGILPKELDDMPKTFSDPAVQEKLVKLFEDSIKSALGAEKEQEQSVEKNGQEQEAPRKKDPKLPKEFGGM